MSDIIHLLPDSVANQIAAGEVIQRPASAVKELLENAVDAGAGEIKLIIKDAGKTLIQVIDNGCGMSETDARMSFERHATSKINDANDLFAIRTLGFRGEALASIAAISQIELKTKRVEDEVGTCIKIEGSEVKSHEPCSASNGTSFSVKNLFFNIPARRKFLKSNTTELRHIIEEFQRVALVYPGIKFSFFNENRQLFQLEKSGLKQRIASLLGASYNNRLVPVEQKTNLINIKGFIGKPEFAKKTRGEQYFFVNGRFIKHPYLNHAVDSAFKELIPSDAYPTYFIYFEINPDEIDINIHPTKTEVKFENNQAIYAMLSSAVKQALGKFNLTPSIDFDIERGVDITPLPANTEVKQPTVRVDENYNPFDVESQRDNKPAFQQHRKPDTSNWQKLYGDQDFTQSNPETESQPEGNTSLSFKSGDKETDTGTVFQLHNKYIVSSVKSGILIIDQQRAHERILFERFLKKLEAQKGTSQQQLFPVTVQFSPSDAAILKEIKDELKVLGFDIEDFGENTFIVNGNPAEMNNRDVKGVLESIIENFKKQLKDITKDKKVNLARSMAVNLSIKQGRKLQPEEIKSLIDQLFACRMPEVSPDGKPTLRILTMDYIDEKFD